MYIVYIYCNYKFKKKNAIPYKENLIGFALVISNIMFEQHYFLKTLLENDVKDLIVLKCVYHSMNYVPRKLV